MLYDIIIIGAGPAGLTSAIYAKRANKNILVLEAKNYGGQIINTLDIENYPANEHISGFDFATNLYNQVKNLGAEIKYEKVVDINNLGKEKEVITTKNTYKTKTIIIATGSENRKLGLPNEDEFASKGISYCATCDGRFFKGKVVGVLSKNGSGYKDAKYNFRSFCHIFIMINTKINQYSHKYDYSYKIHNIKNIMSCFKFIYRILNINIFQQKIY